MKTPEEALKEIYNGMSNNIGFVKEFKNIEKALTRVKKVEELLELYRYVWKTPILSQTISFEEAINRIDKLEEEMK